MMKKYTLISLLFLCCLSCSDNTNNTTNPIDPEQLARQKSVLSQLGQGVFLPAFEDFATKSQALETATKNHAMAPDETTLLAAQLAFNDAMDAWQTVEMYQLGPLGRMGDVAGGQDLRDEIYSWPLVNACRVDQEVVEDVFGDPDVFKAELANVRGLDAMAYLLHAPSEGNACSPNTGINKNGDWAKLDKPTIFARRATYSHTLAILLKRRADALVTLWRDQFLKTYTEAGSNATYPSVQDALNATSDALFYIEKETKDMKLGQPAGITVMCVDAACLEYLESPYARRTKANILVNLRAFETAYLGNKKGEDAKPGFDDLLQGMNATELDTQMQMLITQAIAAVEAIPDTLHGALTTDHPGVQLAYDALKNLTGLVRTQFISVLDLELPKRAEGDND